MRIVTVEYEAYRFNELCDIAKDNVRHWYLNSKSNDIFTEDCVEDLKNLFGKDMELNVQYSLNSCQGDGFNIYGYIHAKDFINCIKRRLGGNQLNPYYSWLSNAQAETILKYAEVCGKIKLPKNNSYCYCMADYIDFASDWISDLKWDGGYDGKDIDKETIYDFENLVSTVFRRLCKDYENIGYGYFYEATDEELEEYCELMDYEFYENGTLFDW